MLADFEEQRILFLPKKDKSFEPRIKSPMTIDEEKKPAVAVSGVSHTEDLRLQQPIFYLKKKKAVVEGLQIHCPHPTHEQRAESLTATL